MFYGIHLLHQHNKKQVFDRKKMNLIIPSNMLIVYTLFLYCAIFLGEVRNYYYRVPHWDTILHTFSGAMIGCIGFSIISLLNDREFFRLNLTPFFIAFFAFCFAIMLFNSRYKTQKAVF